MAIKGISIFESEEYISRTDTEKDKSKATIFILGSLDVSTKARLQDNMMAMESDGINTNIKTNRNTVYLEAVRYGLKGWKNFIDEKGNEIKFDTVKRLVSGGEIDIPSDESLNRLPSNIIRELGEKILNVNSLSEFMEKNLGMGSLQ